MSIERRHIQLALDVRRGLVRQKDLKPDDAPLVAAVLRRTTDAQFAQMAESQQYVTPRCATMTPRRTWHAR